MGEEEYWTTEQYRYELKRAKHIFDAWEHKEKIHSCMSSTEGEGYEEAFYLHLSYRVNGDYTHEVASDIVFDYASGIYDE